MGRHLRQILGCTLLVTSVLASGCLEAPGGHPATSQAELVPEDCMVGTQGGRVEICHATGSASNPYNSITISTNACLNGHLGHPGDVLPDAAGNCCQPSERDCNGLCNGGAVVDCAGTCNGTAVTDTAGGCCEPTNFKAVDVYFTAIGPPNDPTKSGVFRWSSDTASVTQLSPFESYAIAVSASGQIFVGNGGIEAQATGVTQLGTAGIYTINTSTGAHTAYGTNAIAAEDLQFDPNGVLYAANATGIYKVAASGAWALVFANPTSQFTFVSATSVVTTNGSVYSGTFGRGTDLIDFNASTPNNLNVDGGEDIKVSPTGKTLLCGQGGLSEITSSGAFKKLYAGQVFNFGVTTSGDVYIGNSAAYGSQPWPQGLYKLPAGFTTTTSATAIDTSYDIKAMVLKERCQAATPQP